MTSRELVIETLEFRNRNGRAPRHMWTLPWAEIHHGDMVSRIHTEYPDDFASAPVNLSTRTIQEGDPYKVGFYKDEWGCLFTNIHEGIIGEVKQAIVNDEDWEDVENVHIPSELLTFDRKAVNKFCQNTDKFVFAGVCPRPFEQLQFIRGTENLYMDLMDMPEKMKTFLKDMHNFYCLLLEEWAKTDVDALQFMDDWGSQNTLLINPEMWREIFKPMYKDYISIAKKYNKKIFMHSDGNTLQIIPDLIEIGLDALNAQIFCIGVEKLAPYAGKLTFWGEIDRQHMLVEATKVEISTAVNKVKNTLWRNGGCIAQCEFGPGANPENVYEVFRTWNEILPQNNIKERNKE